MKLSYRKKLFLSFVLIFSLFTIGIFLFEYSRERHYKTEALTEKLDAYTEVANAVLIQQGSLDCTDYLFPTNLRLTLIELNGNVIFDNVISETSNLENHSDRLEIILAKENKIGSDIRKSTSNSQKYIYYAKRFNTYYIRVALPYNVQVRNLLKPDNLFIYFIIGFFVITLLIINFASGRFGDSIRKLKDFSNAGEQTTDFPNDELGEIGKKIAENHKRLNESKNAIKELTGNITHELKTPITGLRGCLETVLDKNLDADKKQYFIEKAYNQSLVLSELVQDMGLLTKIEEAPQSFRFEPINIPEMLGELKMEMENLLHEKNMRMKWEMPDNLLIYGNLNLLYAIFRNLTDNALRYAGSNTSILIHLYNEDKNFYFFSYSDTGAGIPDEHHLNRLFERFYSISEGRTRETGGSGLGLSIVKNAVLFHKGIITVNNRACGGLEFLFTLRKFYNA
jgi:signal transduction histidine kinase